MFPPNVPQYERGVLLLNYIELSASKVAKYDIPDLMGDIAADLKGHALNIGAIVKAGESGGIESEQLYPIADGSRSLTARSRTLPMP